MRTRLQVDADRVAEAARRTIGLDLRRLREDAGPPKSGVARTAGIDPTYLGYIEGGERVASLAVLCRICAALGADLSLRIYPNSGPPIRDRIQSRMVEALLNLIPESWARHVEVPVRRPVRGIIDVVLAQQSTGRVISVEAHSELRRLEQQLRWAAEKSDALPSSSIWPLLTVAERPIATSRILLLRSTATTRSLARTFAATLAAAYPADPREIRRALLDPRRDWPGHGILWTRVEGNEASIIDGQPRGLGFPRGTGG